MHGPRSIGHLNRAAAPPVGSGNHHKYAFTGGFHAMIRHEANRKSRLAARRGGRRAASLSMEG
jgi:hypothetical protein